MGKMKDLSINIKCIENDIIDIKLLLVHHEAELLRSKKDVYELWNSIEEVGRIVDEICNTTK